MANAAARVEAELDDEESALLEFFVADDPAAGNEGGFHAFLGSAQEFPPCGHLAWAHLYLLLAEESLPPPPETARHLADVFLLPAAAGARAAVVLSAETIKRVADRLQVSTNDPSDGSAAEATEQAWLAVWGEIRSFLLGQALPRWLQSPGCRLAELAQRQTPAHARQEPGPKNVGPPTAVGSPARPTRSQPWPHRVRELVVAARQRQAAAVLDSGCVVCEQIQENQCERSQTHAPSARPPHVSFRPPPGRCAHSLCHPGAL